MTTSSASSTQSATLSCSVIVPVYNGEATIGACLQALLAQTVPPTQYEIIIVDDGSRDATAAMIRRLQEDYPTHQVRLVQQANAGPAAARNHGAQLARAEILLFTDADCAPEPGWINALLAPFADPTVAGAKGVYLTKQSALTPRFVQAEYEDRYDRMRNQPQIDFVDTYSAAYRRSIFLASGGFDSTFRTASVEDQELSFRLTSQGYRLLFVPEARVYHQHDHSISEYLRRKFYIGYWKTLVVRRYPERIVRDSHTPQSLKVQIMLVAGMLGLLPLGIVTGRWVWRLIPFGIAGVLLSAAPFLRKLAYRSPALALHGVLMILLRALALGSGLLVGSLQLLLQEDRPRRVDDAA
jgi:cellulose synthase/poly-beta-1,6-N-acetylglucosamine synthase-like glycosyltransferase